VAIQTLNDARLYIAEFNLSGDHNQIELEIGALDSPNTVFGNTATSVKGTIRTVELSGQGYVTLGTGNVHAVIGAQINASNVPVTVSPDGVTEGDYAEFFKAITTRYNPFAVGEAGEHMGFSFSAKGQGVEPIQGTILGSGSKTSTGNTAEQNLGAVASTDTIYAAQHVLSVSGTSPTLDTIIQHDTTGFGSATTGLTFAQTGVVGSSFVSDSTATTTDTFWRAKWTIGGSNTPTFNVLIVFGIESHA
jgi:hypothetical protein